MLRTLRVLRTGYIWRYVYKKRRDKDGKEMLK